MVGPEDFGLDPIATLAHVGDSARSSRHAPIWKAWSEAVAAVRPRLQETRDPDPSDPTADQHFESLHHVRIGCRLLEPIPRTRPRAAIVAFHGYGDVAAAADEEPRWAALRSRGVTVLIVRVRGFPGSRRDTGDWNAHAHGWITRGLETAPADTGIGTDWSFAHAAADALLACRAMRHRLGRGGPGAERRAGTSGGPPIFIYGQSFGAALAILAAARLGDDETPARVAIGLPTMGDWPWRLAHRRPGGHGAGAQIARLLVDFAEREESIVATLRAFDPVIHARAVRCPVLCKLALRDDVVPAPSAAAVFNALGTDPGRKWRFVTRYGHFDGGLADLRRHARFEQAADAFLDPASDPEDSLIRWAGGGA